ncbi:iron complex outermembrane receptor protein [Nitrospirillum amazonense]|uniref:Iron complex outermembrane receptor protein n=1 Tax=Nitrospirillum amazonense TaxID=28077 RepID=A0A560ER36_9PROT|nr:TonB-dependent receptor [Nitrospirillum amazonense]TWB11841.1 iron complex outermembrane receptor protein [Nitrospirillum amazonense]
MKTTNRAAIGQSRKVGLSFRLLGTAALALSLAGGAHAAEATSTDDDALTEIIVTAQKRGENLTSVPVAMSVVTGDALAHAGVSTSESLPNLVPGVTFRKGTTNKNSALNIRGIGTLSFSSGAEPSVSTVVDGVVYARSGMAVTDLLDIDRVEVLRGPQGTLFGKNASAGVINIVTADPKTSFGGYAEASGADNGEVRLRSSISAPLSGDLVAQLAAFYGHADGNGRNVHNGHDINGYDHKGARAKLQWTPTDAVKVTFIGDYAEADDNCCAESIQIISNSAANVRGLIPALAPVYPSATNKDINNDVDPRTKDRNFGTSVQVDWALPAGTFTSISAWRGWHNVETRDGDFTASYPAYVGSSVPGGSTSLADHGYVDLNQYSQELRYASDLGGRFDYVGGFFFFHTDTKERFTRSDVTCTASTLAALANGNIPCASGSSTYGRASGTAVDSVTTNNEALFGQGTYHITDDFRLTFGGRLTHDELDYTFQRVATATGFAGIGASFASANNYSRNDASAKAGVQYDLGPNTMAYFTYSQGYKGPAYNIFFNMAANNTGRLSPETSNAYEVGLKTSALDNKVVASLALFRDDIDGFQTNSFTNINGAVVSTLVNAGTVRTQGVELDFLTRPLPGLTLNGGAAYTDATIVQFACPTGAPATCYYPNGKVLPYAPKWKLTADAAYKLPLPDSVPVGITIDTSYSWRADQQMDIGESPATIQKAYGIWNLGVDFAAPEDRFVVRLYAQNLLNQFYTVSKVPDSATSVVNGVAVPSTTYVRLGVPRDAQRILGLGIRTKF